MKRSTSHHFTSRSVGVFAASALLAAATTTAEAVDITNNTSSITFNAVVPGSGLVGKTISPGETDGFNLLGDQTATITVRLTTQASTDEPGAQEILVLAHRGGSVVIDEKPLVTFAGLGIGNPYATGYTTDGFVIDVEPNNADLLFRQVGFAASSDCQFCPPCNTAPDLSDAERVAIPNLTNLLMCQSVNDSTGLRGAIMAGDLTQYPGISHFNAYTNSIHGHERNVYDGLGNHDGDGAVNRVRNFVRDRRRTTMQLGKGSPVPHYSWNWHDMHFIQANIFPANQPDSRFPGIDPGAALSFIQDDLAVHVGDSERPVVLIHHYGFDNFSDDWWTANQRQLYWDVIKNYNVVLILTGHAHYRENKQFLGYINDSGFFVEGRRVLFDLDGFNSGRDSIPAVNVGASRYGAWTDIEFNQRNQIRLTIRDEYGTTYDELVLQHKTPIWVDASQPGEGYGWKDAPFSRLELALIGKHSTGDFPGTSANLDNIPIRVAPGAYDEQLTIDDPIVLAPDGPGSIVLGRP